MPSAELNGNWTAPRKSGLRQGLLWALSLLVVGGGAMGGTVWYLRDGRVAGAEQPSTQSATPPRAVNMPHMELQAQYGGPLLHTIIQRWRDPIDGTVCYMYLPIEVHHTQPTVNGYVEYNAPIGALSCLPPPQPKAVKPMVVPAQ